MHNIILLEYERMYSIQQTYIDTLVVYESIIIFFHNIIIQKDR